tara:strand:- start:1004 stop:1462 length:459 start_codon:yes stop_codon:yes gene_type:complete
MKEETMRKYLLILYLLVFLSAQSSNTQVPLSPVVTYWKALTVEEKETFLFSYLVQVYETHSDLKKDIGYGGITEWYYDNRAELIYGIFDHLDQVGIYQMVKWVDEYYSHGEYANKPFHEALEFAFRFQKAAGSTLLEKYEDLQFKKIKPGDN